MSDRLRSDGSVNGPDAEHSPAPSTPRPITQTPTLKLLLGEPLLDGIKLLGGQRPEYVSQVTAGSMSACHTRAVPADLEVMQVTVLSHARPASRSPSCPPLCA